MISNSDQNLLFGIIAFQMDFVRREELVAATSTWLTDKSRKIEEILVEQGALSEKERLLLAPLVARHLENHGGDPQRSVAALSSIGSVADELRELGDESIEATLLIVASNRPDKWHEQTVAHESRASSAKDASPSEAADSRFRILRSHAKGGLGEVYVAKDTELNREVALKEIQTKYADDQASRLRFLLEAEVTGGLEHPGIVPVYGLGRYDDGRPFYAMRFIKGDSLQEAADRFHGEAALDADLDFNGVEFRKLIGRFVDVCQAIEYAHSRGVLHRDLKPGNIMLGKYGETLVVDWGLAKLQERDDETKVEGETTLQPSSGSGSAPTQFGSAIGTPAYMPPEQAAGKLDELGPKSDVYSLGATLCHLLTGQSPVTGRNLGELLKKVQQGDFVAPRRVNSNVPKSLNAICLRAMARRPQDRYASPQELADDVERFLADEPVAAHAEPLVDRARRWVRKHQTVAVSASAVVLVSAVGLGVFATIVSGKNTQLAELIASLDQRNVELMAANQRETEARELAEANEQIAREQSQLALSTLASSIDDLQGGLKNVSGGGDVRRRLLSTSLQRLERVASKYVGQSAVDHQTLYALIEMGDVVLRFGSAEQHASAGTTGEPTADQRSAVGLAQSFYRRAHEIAQALVEAAPNNIRDQRNLSVSYERLGDTSLRSGEFREAANYFLSSLEVSQRLALADPTDTEAQRNLSISYEDLAEVNLMAGELQVAVDYARRALAISQRLAQADTTDAQAQQDLAASYMKLGKVSLAADAESQAEDCFRASNEITKRLAQVDPADTQAQRDLASSYLALGDAHLRTGAIQEAVESFRESLDINQRLAMADPADSQIQRELSNSCERLGAAHERLDDWTKAEAFFRRMLEIKKRLADADSGNAVAQSELSLAYGRLGGVSLKAGAVQDAIENLQKCNQIVNRLAQDNAADTRLQQDLFVSHYKIAMAHQAAQAWPEAAAEFREAASVLAQMIDRKQLVEFAERAKADMEALTRNAERAGVALGDWDALLEQSEKTLSALLDLRGIELAKQQRFIEAAQAATKLRELESADNGQLYNAACVFCLCAAAIKPGDGKEMSAEQKETRQQHIADALATLKLAVEVGWDDFAHMKRDPDLAILRDRPEFKSLLPQPPSDDSENAGRDPDGRERSGDPNGSD